MTYTAEQFAQLSLLHLEAVKRADAANAMNAIYCNEIKALKNEVAHYKKLVQLAQGEQEVQDEQ